MVARVGITALLEPAQYPPSAQRSPAPPESVGAWSPGTPRPEQVPFPWCPVSQKCQCLSELPRLLMSLQHPLIRAVPVSLYPNSTGDPHVCCKPPGGFPPLPVALLVLEPHNAPCMLPWILSGDLQCFPLCSLVTPTVLPGPQAVLPQTPALSSRCSPEALQCSPRYLAGAPPNPPAARPGSTLCSPRTIPEAPLNTPLPLPNLPRHPRPVSPGIPPKAPAETRRCSPELRPCRSLRVAPGPPPDTLPVPPQLPRPRVGPLPVQPLQSPPMAAPGPPPAPPRYLVGVPPAPPRPDPTHSRQSA